MFCIKCGAQLQDGAKFCFNCGQSIQTAQEQAPQDKGPLHLLPSGTVLRGRYRVEKVLGQGGFGITYLGFDMLMEKQVAIKEFYPDSAVYRDCSKTLLVSCTSQQTEFHFQASKARFLREAKALVKFQDIPEVVDIMDFIEENNTAYIVMEYVQGMSLAKYVAAKGGRLTAEETFTLLKPVMQALAAVHKGGIVHRDIAPDNIILHPMGGAKLLDFGAVRALESNDTDSPLAKSTEAILKHGFAPIEQYNSRGSLGPWTDEYAMCATIYYCLTGKIPAEASVRISEGAELGWNSIPGLLPHQAAALEKAMSLRAKDRFPDMDQLLAALFSVPQPVAPAPEPVEVPQPAFQPPVAPASQPAPQNLYTGGTAKKKFPVVPVVIAAVAVVVLAAVIIAVLLGGGKTSISELYASEDWTYGTIVYFDGTYPTRKCITEVPDRAEEIWAAISELKVKEEETGDSELIWNSANIHLEITPEDGGRYMVIAAMEDGRMFIEDYEYGIRYFSGCQDVYAALWSFLSNEPSVSMAECIPDNDWISMTITFWEPNGDNSYTLFDMADSNNPADVVAFVDRLQSYDATFGGGTYWDYNGYYANLQLYAADGTSLILCVYGDGNADFPMGDWTVGFYDAVDIYDMLWNEVCIINGY